MGRLDHLFLGVLLGIGVNASANATIYTFSESGDNFATLDITQGSGSTWQFVLNALDVSGSGNYDYVSQIFFQGGSPVPSSKTALVMSSGQAADNAIGGAGNSQEISAAYSFSFDFNDGSAVNGGPAKSALRFEEGEAGSWTAEFSSPLQFSAMGITLANNGGQNHQDVFATVAAIPEPETYGMLLVGLALVGYSVSRRKV